MMTHPPQPTNQGGAPPPGKKKYTSSVKSVFLWAEGQQESGGDYSVVNSSSGALGRWQVMPDNVCSWGEQSGIGCVSPQTFLDSPKDQDAVAYTILGGYFDQYGPAGAAAMWYSGQPDPNEQYGDPTVQQYVDDVLNWMKSSPYLPAGEAALLNTGSNNPALAGLPNPPAPGKTSWAAQVRGTGDEFGRGARNAQLTYSAVAKLRIRR